MSSSLLKDPHLLSSLKEDVMPIKNLVTLKGSSWDESIVCALITKERHMQGLVVTHFYYQLSRWICTKRSNNAITRLDHWTLWYAHKIRQKGLIIAGQLCKLERTTTDLVNRAMLCGFGKALAAHTHTEAQFTSTPGGGVTANTTCQDKSVTMSLLSSQWTRLYPRYRSQIESFLIKHYSQQSGVALPLILSVLDHQWLLKDAVVRAFHFMLKTRADQCRSLQCISGSNSCKWILFLESIT